MIAILISGILFVPALLGIGIATFGNEAVAA